MSPEPPNPPLPVRMPPEVGDRELDPLLAEPFANAWAHADAARAGTPAVRDRLLQRLAASRAAESAMVTVRRRRLPSLPLASGVTVQTLYVAPAAAALRPGEPLRARLIELAPGAQLDPEVLDAAGELAGRHLEWLLMAGSARLGGQTLSQRDYQVDPAGHAPRAWSSDAGALLFLRESALPARPGDAPYAVRDADAGWPDFAPGIQRRVLWQHAGQAAMLYYAQPGAQVPQHSHGHDEECLMLQGELFLDDLLLQPGDYQLAPAGSGHRTTETDTGIVIYAHGDLDLRFV